MPANIQEIPTNELIESTDFSFEEIVHELQARVVDLNDTTVELQMRGGIRPSRPNL